MKKLFFYFIAASLLLSCKDNEKSSPKITVLKGLVIGRPPTSKYLYLIDKNKDYRINADSIPIVDGKFNYSLKSNDIQQFQMAFNDELEQGSWMGVDFYNDADTIQFTLYSMAKADDNIILGGSLNQKQAAVIKEAKTLFWKKVSQIQETKVASLEKRNQWYSKERNDLFDLLKKNENDFVKRNEIFKKVELLRKNKRELTPQARVFKNKIDNIISKYKHWQDSILATDNSLYGYTLLMDKLYSNTYDKNFNIYFIENRLNTFSKLFPNHPYTKSANDIILGVFNSKVGGFYTDFSAKTTTDNLVRLSSVVTKNKLTLIDLWAPWCGPCIAKDKVLLPEYEKLHKKGFEVFAVIGGISEREDFVKTQKKYAYPWPVHYELNQEFGIWNKYNISRSGGSQFLVNSKGKILAVNPNPTVIDSILVSMSMTKS